jgi:hypothetical protein
MPRFALRLAYDGTDFHGWQRQEPPGLEPLRTVQGELDRALTDVLHAPVNCQGASRTDAGVHAEAQVAAFTAECRVPLERLHSALNARLPGDVRAMAAWQVPDDFDPIRDARSKGYRYEVARMQPFVARLPFDRRFLYEAMHPLDVERMRRTEAEAFRKLDPHRGGMADEDIRIGDWMVQRACPHREADLSVFGEIEGSDLVCTLHGWRFDLETGRCRNADDRPLRVRRAAP